MKPEINSHALVHLTGSHHLQIVQAVVKLHETPCPNLNVMNEAIEDIIDIFWMKFKDFHPTAFNLTVLVVVQ